MIKNIHNIFISLLILIVLCSFFSETVFAVGVPKIINHQGRLLDSAGSLLGGSGTDYCFKFAIYDDSTVGGPDTKLWPTGSPSTMTIVVKRGVFNVGVGDTVAGGDTLDFNFQDDEEVYLNVEVATKVGGSCTTGGDETFENLGPRQRINSSGYAINSDTVDGFHAGQSATGSQLVALTSGNLVLGGTNPQLNMTGSNTLTLQGGAGTGDIQFFSSSFKITSAGDLSIAKVNGLTLTSSTGTLTITNGKTLTASNTLTFSGTDSSTLNIGTGGTLGTNAYTSTAYAPLASPTFTGTVTIPTPFTLGATSVTSTGTQLNYLASATGTTGTTSTNLVFSTSPTLVTPVLGVASATSINGLTLTSSTGTLTITNGKTLTASNTLTFSGTDSSTLNIGTGGTLGTNAYTSTAYAPLDSPTFTGTLTIPTPFTLGATSVTSTGTQLNYLASATGTTGTTSTNLVFSTSPTLVTPVLGVASATSITSPTYTGTAAVDLSSGGTSALTLNSASGDIAIAANNGLTFATTTLGNNGSRNLTINAGTTGTTATLLVKLDTSGNVITTDTTTLNNAVGVSLDTKTSGQADRVAVQGSVTVTADNTVTAGDYIGVGTTTAGRAKSLGTTYPSTAGIQVVGRALGGASAGSTFLLMLSGLENNVSAGGGSLQSAYDSGATIELAAGTPTLITETTASVSSHDLLQLTSNPATTGTYSGDALQITMDGADANSNTGSGLRIIVDKSQATGMPIIIEDDAGVDMLALSQSGGLTIGSATARLDTTSFGDFTSEGLDIQQSLTGIIDIFVYDTTRDVDGGEWRNSLISQQMSWAVETKDDGVNDVCVVASDDRCGTSTFPRKAILITTATALYIFDGSSNTLWMKFTQAGTYALGADTNNNPSGVAAENGVIVVGTNGASATGMYAFDFKQDTMYRYNTTNRTQADVSIGNRNSTATYANNAETALLIIDNIVNDVSIAVQSASAENLGGTLLAPIDSQGGPRRGVTLIAAATDSGVSLVNMGDRRIINYSDATNNDYNQVVLTHRGRMYATNEALAQLEEWRGVDTVNTTQANGTPTRVYDETLALLTPITLNGTAPVISTSPSALTVIERASSAKEASAAGQIDSGDIVFVGTDQGLAEVHTSGGLLPAASWSKITTKDSATPYMVGGVRSVYLFDEAAGATTAASAVGAAGTTRNPLDQAGATAPTFGGAGIRGGAVNFNNNSYLCSDANADGTCDTDADILVTQGSFTISLWFKHGVTAAQDTLFERCWTPATPAVAVGCIWGGMTAAGTIKIGLDSITTWTYETTYDDSVISTATYNDDKWHHLVYTNTDTDICLYIDGRLAAACDTALAATATLDASQVLTIGGVCTGANCTTGTNFWDGSIDEFVWSSSAANNAANGMIAGNVNKLFLDGRTHMIRPSATVTNATTFTSTTIGEGGAPYVPNAFVGLPVELTGGTGSGQTRTIISNDTNTFTVYPAFSTTPDATTDYRVAPSRLYGASNNVTSVAVDAPTQLNKIRKIYVGTSDGSDGGGVSVFTNAGAGGLKTEVFSSDSGVTNDDLGVAWSGTDADDITALSAYSDTLVLGNQAFFRSQRKDVSLKSLQNDFIGGIEDIRQQLVASGLFGATQDVLGLGQGADLAEYYTSDEILEQGSIVSADPKTPQGVRLSKSAYQNDVLGVVATKPGIILGPRAENSYPVALVGRIPVKITTENGIPKIGDRITSSPLAGYGMRATKAGRVLGVVIEEVDNEKLVQCPGDLIDAKRRCTQVMVFVNLVDYMGTSIETLMAEEGFSLSDPSSTAGLSVLTPLVKDNLDGDTAPIEDKSNGSENQWKIVEFLKRLKGNSISDIASEIFADRITAAVDMITTSLTSETIYVNSLEADTIIGTAIRTDSTSSEKFLNIKGGIDVEGLANLRGGLRVDRIGELDKVIEVLADVLYVGRPIFSSDTAGFAKIEKDAKSVKIIFDRPYDEDPVVNVTLTSNEIIIPADLTKEEEENLTLSETEEEEVIDEIIEEVFAKGIVQAVSQKSVKGFTIILNKPAPADLTFSWVAFAVKSPKTFVSSPIAEALRAIEEGQGLVVNDDVVTKTKEEHVVESTADQNTTETHTTKENEEGISKKEDESRDVPAPTPEEESQPDPPEAPVEENELPQGDMAIPVEQEM